MSDTQTESRRPTRPEPPISETTEEFWNATREQKLVIQWCKTCEKAIMYPREVCVACFGTDLEYRPASGKGVVYAFSVQHRPANPMFAAKVPYTVAIVELDEGVRMMSNVINCPWEDVAVDMPVEVTWEPLSDGRNLPQFQPASK